MLHDYRTAPINEREKALFAFVEKMNRESSRLRKDDVEEAKAAGWSEEALYDAITVCALFNFYNRWCDAAGVHDLPRGAYRMAAKRMSGRGYRMEF